MGRYSTEVETKVRGLLSDADTPTSRVSLIAEVGSTAHNISAGTDDLDLTVVWTESLTDLMTLTPKGAKMLRTQPEGSRSGPGDIDLQVYTMRKFVNLATAGNPSILNVLFVPPEMRMLENEFPYASLIPMCHTKAAGKAFLGYCDAQLDRWVNHQVHRRVHRPELVEKHGYDTKYAAHAIRLGIQGTEFLTTGQITIPMQEPASGWLREIRAGRVREADALAWAHDVRKGLKHVVEHSDLPEKADRLHVDGFLTNWHWEYM